MLCIKVDEFELKMVKMNTVKGDLNKIYYDLSSPSAFSGLSAVYKQAKKQRPNLKRKDVEEYMLSQDTYTLHKPARHYFPRNRVVASGIDSDWQADLCDVQSLKKYNDNVSYLLTVIDVLSKHGWAVPIPQKTPEMVKKAFMTILKQSMRHPGRLFTDQGKEFVGKIFKTFLEGEGILHLTSRDPNVKASVVERYNRTLKSRIWKYLSHHNTHRYIDAVPHLVNAINHSYQRMIKMRPVDVTAENEAEVWQTLYGKMKEKSRKEPKFHVGEKVRIGKYKHIFEKGYLPNYTEEVFEISQVVHRIPTVYRLKDYNGEPIEGVFYGYELVKVIKDETEEHYKIEKVLKTRTKKGVKEVFVKWKGYPNKFNQWIPQAEIVELLQ